MNPTLLHAPPGSLIDGWQVSRALGDGGFACVYLGEKNGRHRAIKVAQHRESSGDLKRTHARTLRELTALLMLDHPNIVRPQGHGLAESGNLYLALDYVDGWTLSEWAERKHPTVREILGVFEKLAGALAYMHGRGILHRDLKLSNVLIRKSDGEPIIIDFSCATYTLAEGLTDGGLPPGTERYRAPEQFQFLHEHKDEPRARYAFQVADEVFAVGVMLHELLTDPRPTKFRPRFDLNDATLPPPSPRRLNARVPEAVSDLIESVVALDPKRRPVDTEALRRELAELLTQSSREYDVPAHPPAERRQGEPPPADVAIPPLRQSSERRVARVGRPRSSGRWFPGLVGVVVLVVAAVLWRYAAAVSGAPVEPRVASGPRPPSPLQSDPPRTAPPAMSSPGLSPVTPSARERDDAQKEGSTVKTPPPGTLPSGRTLRVPKKSVAAVECVSLSLVAALAAGCPSAQLRPESFTCPEGAREAMRNHLHWRLNESFTLQLDANEDELDYVWFTAGAEVVSVVPESTSTDDRQAAVAPPGTRFYGKAYYLSDKMGRVDGPALIMRYDRVKLPGQDEQPICVVVEENVYAFKDGKVKGLNRVAGHVVSRWP